jgi:WD40 repeat protein
MSWAGFEGRRIVLTGAHDTGQRESRVRLLELEGDSLRVVWEAQHLAAVGSAVFSPDCRLLATGSYDGGNGVRIWDADTGKLVRELTIGDAIPWFSRDGRRLYTTTGRMSPDAAECRSWSTATWETERVVPLNRITSSPALLWVAADGTVAVTFNMNDVRLLDPETLAEYATLVAPEPGMRFTIAFSPDSSTLATSARGAVQLWNLRRLHQELAELDLDWHGPRQAPVASAPGP